jgi:hypothetical protein
VLPRVVESMLQQELEQLPILLDEWNHANAVIYI